MARDGLAYGPLTDLPDWSFAGIDITHFIKFLILYCTNEVIEMN